MQQVHLCSWWGLHTLKWLCLLLLCENREVSYHIGFAARGSWAGNMASPDVVPACPVTASGVIGSSVVHSKDLAYVCSLCIPSFWGCIMFLVCSAWVCFLLLQNIKPNLVCEKKGCYDQHVMLMSLCSTSAIPAYLPDKFPIWKPPSFYITLAIYYYIVYYLY